MDDPNRNLFELDVPDQLGSGHDVMPDTDAPFDRSMIEEWDHPPDPATKSELVANGMEIIDAVIEDAIRPFRRAVDMRTQQHDYDHAAYRVALGEFMVLADRLITNPQAISIEDDSEVVLLDTDTDSYFDGVDILATAGIIDSESDWNRRHYEACAYIREEVFGQCASILGVEGDVFDFDTFAHQVMGASPNTNVVDGVSDITPQEAILIGLGHRAERQVVLRGGLRSSDHIQHYANPFRQQESDQISSVRGVAGDVRRIFGAQSEGGFVDTSASMIYLVDPDSPDKFNSYSYAYDPDGVMHVSVDQLASTHS